MSSGTYGIKKPAFITSNDVEMFYHYRPNRASEASDFKTFQRLDSSLLTNSKAPMDDGNDTISELTGMYDLRLPLNLFGKVGIYTVYMPTLPNRFNGKRKSYIPIKSDIVSLPSSIGAFELLSKLLSKRWNVLKSDASLALFGL